MAANDWRGETYAALQLASTTSQWPSYATFADLQKRGLRKEAMVQLRPFADSLADQALAQRWAFVSWLCSEVLAERVVTQPLVPMPLRSAVVVPTLFEQRDADPGDPRATIWLVGRFTAEVYEEMCRSYDIGVAEFLDLSYVKPNILGNTRMLLVL